MEYKVNKHLQIAGGEMLVPVSRQALQSTLSFYTINISPVSTVNNTRPDGIGAARYGLPGSRIFL